MDPWRRTLASVRRVDTCFFHYVNDDGVKQAAICGCRQLVSMPIRQRRKSARRILKEELLGGRRSR